jgi:hypothetical protein
MARDWPTILKDAKQRNVSARALSKELGCDSAACHQAAKRYGIELPPVQEFSPITFAAPYDPAIGEEWRPLPDYSGYEISAFARVRRPNGTFVATGVGHRGYVLIPLRAEGRARTCRLHRLVAAAFISNPNGLPHVNHIDCDKLNNSVTNLEWMSRMDNYWHAHKAGIWTGGSNPNRAPKLSGAAVIAIRDAYASGIFASQLAKRFGISKAHAYNVATGKKRANG